MLGGNFLIGNCIVALYVDDSKDNLAIPDDATPMTRTVGVFKK
jgi:hypothetical protein